MRSWGGGELVNRFALLQPDEERDGLAEEALDDFELHGGVGELEVVAEDEGRHEAVELHRGDVAAHAGAL